MASPVRLLLRYLRGIQLPDETPAEIGKYELLVLLVLIERPSRSPEKLAKVTGIRRRRIERAWRRLEDAELTAAQTRPEREDPPVFAATEAGRNLAGDVMMALEIADFEPHLLGSLRSDERKAPFRRADGPLDL